MPNLARVAAHFAIGSAFILWGFLGAVPLLWVAPMLIPAVLFVGGAIAGLCLQSTFPGAIWRVGLGAVSMGLVGLVLIPRWVPIDASEGTVRGLVLTIGSIFGAGLPFLLTMRDETGATQMRRTVIAFGRGAGIAAVAASALLWSGQTERWVVIGVGFPIGFVATGTMLSLRIGGTDTIA